METADSLDLTLGLDSIIPPEAHELDRAHRRAIAAAVAQGVYAVWLVCMFVIGWVGHSFVESDAMLIVDGLIALVALIIFLVWFWDAYRLAQAFSPTPLAATPGWAVGVFFIPLANFVLPYQRAREIEEASDLSSFTLDLRPAGGRGLIGVWWALWLLSSVSIIVFDQIPEGGTSWEILGLAVGLSTVASSLVTALFAIRTDADQQALGDHLLDLPPLAPEAAV